jgi:hypothetical protein
MQVLEWQNMHAALDPAKPEEARFTRIACGASIEEHHRPQMLERLEFCAHSASIARSGSGRPTPICNHSSASRGNG